MSAKNEYMSDSLPNQYSSGFKPTIIGIYGIPGCGKTYLIKQLEKKLEPDSFQFYEGSKVIASLVPGGLDAFKRLEEKDKLHWRQLAIEKISMECIISGCAGIVAGHFMFWPEGEKSGQQIYTESDMRTYTHIIYLDVPAEVIAQRRQNDTARDRPSESAKHLHNWKEAEKMQLRRLCGDHGILFSLVTGNSEYPDKVEALIRNFEHDSEADNLLHAQKMMDEVIMASRGNLETVLVLDADRTLSAQDSGKIFWDIQSKSQRLNRKEDPLKTLFSSSMGYSYTAFRQAALLYEEVADEPEFNEICNEVASSMLMYPEFLSLLHLVAEQGHVRAVIVTCGLRRVWEKIMEREGLSTKISVVGGGRIKDGLIITGAVKAAIVTRLRSIHHKYVWAFGDSVLDLPMLREADQAIVVVGEEKTRSKIMDAALLNAIENDGLSARQCVLPNDASPRLDTNRLPVVLLEDPEFISSIIHRQNQTPFQVFHATNRSASKLLMSPMRNATIAGPALREAHRRVGWYLATEFLAEIIGVAEYPILHVQGYQTNGYRIRNEATTSIIALMRGGEPMALGVNDALPSAMFIHAKVPVDIKADHLNQQNTVILVDSVVNSGKTAVEFVQHVHSLHPAIRIVLIAGVVQAESIADGGPIQTIARGVNFILITLRLSNNKFTGKGTTDTGNRLFNTTQLP